MALDLLVHFLIRHAQVFLLGDGFQHQVGLYIVDGARQRKFSRTSSTAVLVYFR